MDFSYLKQYNPMFSGGFQGTNPVGNPNPKKASQPPQYGTNPVGVTQPMSVGQPPQYGTNPVGGAPPMAAGGFQRFNPMMMGSPLGRLLASIGAYNQPNQQNQWLMQLLMGNQAQPFQNPWMR